MRVTVKRRSAIGCAVFMSGLFAAALAAADDAKQRPAKAAPTWSSSSAPRKRRCGTASRIRKKTSPNRPKGKIGYWGYTKLALISDQVRLNQINNREIAVGGGVQLSAKQKNPLALTLDIAHARFFHIKLYSFRSN